MMFGFFTILFALFALAAGFSFLWGIGSAMMNGVRYSSLGPSLATALVSAGLSWGCLQVATILMNAK